MYFRVKSPFSLSINSVVSHSIIFSFLIGLQPILFALVLTALLLDVNFIRPVGNFFVRKHGDGNRPGMRSFVRLLHCGHLCSFRLSHVLTYKSSLLKLELGAVFFISAPSDSVRLQNPSLTRRSRESSSADYSNQDDDDGNHEESVNETAHGVGSY